jgi:hypothetical protein
MCAINDDFRKHHFQAGTSRQLFTSAQIAKVDGA